MKRLTIGLLAHVDAGKTTLSEAMLYQAGAVRRLGRVDHKDAFLDTDWQERERGITIFSKQALLSLDVSAFLCRTARKQRGRNRDHACQCYVSELFHVSEFCSITGCHVGIYALELTVGTP